MFTSVYKKATTFVETADICVYRTADNWIKSFFYYATKSYYLINEFFAFASITSSFSV